MRLWKKLGGKSHFVLVLLGQRWNPLLGTDKPWTTSKAWHLQHFSLLILKNILPFLLFKTGFLLEVLPTLSSFTTVQWCPPHWDHCLLFPDEMKQLTEEFQGSCISSPQSPRHQQQAPPAFLPDPAFPCLYASLPHMHSTFSPQPSHFKSQIMPQDLAQKLPPPLSLPQTSPFLLNASPFWAPSWSSPHAYVLNLIYLISFSRTLEIERNFVENSKEPVFYATKKLLFSIKWGKFHISFSSKAYWTCNCLLAKGKKRFLSISVPSSLNIISDIYCSRPTGAVLRPIWDFFLIFDDNIMISKKKKTKFTSCLSFSSQAWDRDPCSSDLWKELEKQDGAIRKS